MEVKEKPKADFYRHNLGIFHGYARKDTKKSKDGYKVGLEYEYQFIKEFGLRVFADYEAGDLNKWLFGGGGSFHVPKTGLIAFLGGGIERKNGKSEEFLRLSGEYKFKLKDGLFVAPAAGYDFGRKGSGAWFAGMMIGVGF